MKKLFSSILFLYLSFASSWAITVEELLNEYKVPISHLKYFKPWMLKEPGMIPARVWPVRVYDLKRAQGLKFTAGIVPQELLEFMAWDNSLGGYPEPKIFVPKSDEELQFIENLKLALESIPKKLYQAVEKKTMGLYLIRGLGSAGYTLATHDLDGKEMGAYTLLDYDYLNKEIDVFFNDKEKTAFTSGVRRVELRLSPKDLSVKDKKVATIRSILLHEFAHILAMGIKNFPRIEGGAAFESSELHPFLKQSWLLEAQGIISPAAKDDAFRTIVFYKQDKAGKNELLPSIYKKLSQSNFASLYATISPHEDFAEAFFIYVHHYVLGMPHQTTVYENEKPLFSFSSCLIDKRCIEKKKIIEEFYNQL